MRNFTENKFTMRIAVVYSLPTRRAIASPFIATDEDTKASAEEVGSALRSKGMDVVLVPVSQDSIGKIRDISADMIFNLLEWDGADGALLVRAMETLDLTGIPYTGSSKEALAVCNDKFRMKASFDRFQLPSPRWQKFETGHEAVREDFRYPVIVKLGFSHCSVGLTKDAVVTDQERLIDVITDRIHEFGQPVYAEEFIVGRELQVTVLDRADGIRVLPPAEIFFTTSGVHAFLTYPSRWDETHADYHESSVGLAVLEPQLARAITMTSIQAFEDLGLAGYARLDMRLDGQDIYILEANANPGLGDSADYGMTVSYQAEGLTFADFILEIVSSCRRRTKR
jgi:D-alanine-D-alanine ligase